METPASTAPEPFYLTSLELENFRCFSNLKLSLHPRMNVLTGVNASGKTALLEAIRIGVGVLPNTILENAQGTTENSISVRARDFLINQKDIKYDINFKNKEINFKSSCSFYFCWEGRQISSDQKGVPWKEYPLDSNKMNITINKTINNLSNIENSAYLNFFTKSFDTYLHSIESIPLMVCFPTSRLNRVSSKDIIIPIKGSRLNGYIYWDAENFINSKSINSWIKDHEFNIFQAQRRGESAEEASPEILVFKNALKHCMPELKDFYYGVREEEVLYVLHDRKLPFSYWSDGVRNLILMIADISLRCAILNPDMGIRANESPGIVLIDEVDLHLHPQWQRRVLPGLVAAFPNMQFIVTTHAPMTLASVEDFYDPEKDGVFRLKPGENGEIEIEDLEIDKYGTANEWLKEIFELDEPRSLSSEEAIKKGKAVLKNAALATAAEIAAANEALQEHLNAHDPFWIRWNHFAEKSGITL